MSFRPGAGSLSSTTPSAASGCPGAARVGRASVPLLCFANLSPLWDTEGVVVPAFGKALWQRRKKTCPGNLGLFETP